MVSRPVIPTDLLKSVRIAVAKEINQTTIHIGSQIEPTFKEKLSHWIMPYSIGTVTASVFALLLLTFILTINKSNNELAVTTPKPENSTVLLAKTTPDDARKKLSLPPEYAQISVAGNLPEVNPTGALMALTKSIVGGNVSDEEVVIVAEVFGNGIAKINEVVDPPSNKKAMTELQKAFQEDPENAPFLPTKLKDDSKSIRIVLKIQRVDVVDLQPKK
jgi:hypothetical protein